MNGTGTVRDDGNLFDRDGARKYLSATERARFLAAATREERLTRIFCCLLVLTGCRISEALELTVARLDAETCRVIFRTLKRRKRVFRAVPVPQELMRDLLTLAGEAGADRPLFPWCRQTAWRHVKAVMDAAGISGAQATAKGLRHAYGIANAESNVPPGLTQRWMGHARLETTAIYQMARELEERAFAERLWAQFSPDR